MKLIEFKIETQVEKKIYIEKQPSTALLPFVPCYLVHL